MPPRMTRSDFTFEWFIVCIKCEYIVATYVARINKNLIENVINFVPTSKSMGKNLILSLT